MSGSAGWPPPGAPGAPGAGAGAAGARPRAGLRARPRRRPRPRSRIDALVGGAAGEGSGVVTPGWFGPSHARQFSFSGRFASAASA